MKNLLKEIKFIFYRLVTKKMLISIILGLLFFIFFNNSNVHAVVNYEEPIGTNDTIYAVIDNEESFLQHFNSLGNAFLSQAYWRYKNFGDTIFLQIMAESSPR